MHGASTASKAYCEGLLKLLRDAQTRRTDVEGKFKTAQIEVLECNSPGFERWPTGPSFLSLTQSSRPCGTDADYLGMDIEDDLHLLWIADEALQMDEPTDWLAHQAPDGREYYHEHERTSTRI